MPFENVADEFFLDKDIAFVNHGSYGAVPKCVLDQKMKFDVETERNPDLWMRKTSIDLWFENRKAIAPYFGTDPANLAFIHNTTSGANAVLSSICWKPGDVILVTNCTYLAVRNACDDAAKRHQGIEVSVAQLPYPCVNDEDYVKAFSSAADAIIESGKNPRLAIVDGIGSAPAIRYPFEKIVKVLKQRSMEVFVDGAHTPGHIELNLDALGADYFAGNLHKWFFCPKGTAVLWVAPKHQVTIRGPIVSFDFAKWTPLRFPDPLSGRFYWQGTLQNTGYACVTKALEFCDRLRGMHEIMAYNRQLADKAIELIVSEVPEYLRFAIPDSCVAPNLRNFFHAKMVIDEEMTLRFYEEERVWVILTKYNDKSLFRLSSQVYNTIDDFKKLAAGVRHFPSVL